MGCLRLQYEAKLTVHIGGKTQVGNPQKSSRLPQKSRVETGYYYYGARYYNPKVSNWLSVDAPLINGHYLNFNHDGGVLNTFNLGAYIYSRNSPVVYIDPDGNQVNAVTNGVASGNNVVNDITPSVSRGPMKSISGVVLHRTVSTGDAGPIRNSKVNKGVPGFHIIIDVEGKTTQLVNLNNRANHVGKTKGKSGISNSNSIGIEIVGMGYDKNGKTPYEEGYDGKVVRWDPLTPEQVESAAASVATIMQTYDLTLEDIHNHEDVSYKENGEGSTVYNSIINRVKEIINPPKKTENKTNSSKPRMSEKIPSAIMDGGIRGYFERLENGGCF